MSQYDDGLVVLKINKYIRASYASLIKAKGNPTVCEVLDAAQAAAEAGRLGQFDTTGRDAEYYLKCRWQVAGGAANHYLGLRVGGLGSRLARPFVATGGVVLNIGYDALKIACIGAGHPEWLQSDSKPITMPGGSIWGIIGISDGKQDDGSAHRMPRLIRAAARGPAWGAMGRSLLRQYGPP